MGLLVWIIGWSKECVGGCGAEECANDLPARMIGPGFVETICVAYVVAILAGPSHISSLANFGLWIPQTWRCRGRSLWYLTQRPLPSWIRNRGKAFAEEPRLILSN